MPKIRFSREKKEVECARGDNLRLVAIANGIQLYPGIKRVLNCRGKALCGDCRVHVLKGMENLSPVGWREKFRVALSYFKFGHEHEVRLACQTRVEGDVEILTQPEFNWFGERQTLKGAAARE
jgi:ferredoxin